MKKLSLCLLTLLLITGTVGLQVENAVAKTLYAVMEDNSCDWGLMAAFLEVDDDGTATSMTFTCWHPPMALP